MAVTYSAALKDARMQQVADLIAGLTPAGSTGTPTAGKLLIRTAAGVTLVSIDLPADPFTNSGGVLTLNGVPIAATAVASGIAAKAQFRDNAGNVIVSNLTAGTAGSNVTIGSTTIEAGEYVVLTGCTITHG